MRSITAMPWSSPRRPLFWAGLILSLWLGVQWFDTQHWHGAGEPPAVCEVCVLGQVPGLPGDVWSVAVPALVAARTLGLPGTVSASPSLRIPPTRAPPHS